MFVTRHAGVAASVSRLRAFGVDRSHTERTLPGLYDVPTLGLNYRMGEMQAALGRSQLRRIEENLERRRVNFEALERALHGLAPLRVLDAAGPDAGSSHYCLSVVVEGSMARCRDEIVKRLNAGGVGTSVYYPQPVPRMRYYRDKYGYDASRFRQATAISDHSVALPVGPHIAGEDIEYMADALRRALREVNP